MDQFGRSTVEVILDFVIVLTAVLITVKPRESRCVPDELVDALRVYKD
jgi:hypothetical protein